MSQENVEAFTRTARAINRWDVEATLKELDPEVEWRPAMLKSLEADATVYRGHDGMREWIPTLHETFSEIHLEFPEIRDLGDQVLAIGSVRMRGEASGVETESPFAYLVKYRDGKATQV